MHAYLSQASCQLAKSYKHLKDQQSLKQGQAHRRSGVVTVQPSKQPMRNKYSAVCLLGADEQTCHKAT